MKTIYLILALLPILITGCSTTSSDKAPESFTAASEKGLAIGSITFVGDVPQNDIYRFFYYPASADKKFTRHNKGKIEIKGRQDDVRAFNGDFNDKKTYLFVIEREPGSYAFTEYNYLNHIGYTGMVNFSPKFSIPFDIAKGAVQYIGEFKFDQNATPGTPRIVVSDQMQRDLAEIKRKFPNIQWDAAINKTPKTGDTGGGIVEFQ